MPFVPFQSFDLDAPRNHPAPALWLRSHRRPWAFPRRAATTEIDDYTLWLHIHRLAGELSARERALRPSLSFRLRVFLHRLWFLYGATNGSIPREALHDLQADERHDSEGNDQ